LHEDNRMLGGFSLKSFLFPRPSTATATAAVTRQHDLIRSVWTELIKLIDMKKIDPLVDTEWSFEEVRPLFPFSVRQQLALLKTCFDCG
uniref:DHC_N2 domain-containing protein n=1 Tax=Echinostoma caproni TaxID=27848 RepID=A0A183B5J5_9TREM